MNNKGTTLLIVILSILVIVAGGMLIYKINNEKEKSENVVADDNVDINEDKDDKELVVEEKKPQIFNGNDRPIAVMIDNHSGAWPQANLNKAYLVYEIIVEGGETRLMAVFKGQDLEKIGPIRSSRHYFLDYALENDAIYVHWGWSPQAQSDIKTLGVNNINGLYDAKYFYRDQDLKSQKVALEHTGFTTMKMLKKGAEKLKYNRDTNRDTLLNYQADEVNLEQKEGSLKATNVMIKYSGSVKDTYEYDAENKVYKRFVNGKAHTDDVTKKQYTFKNIIVYNVKNSSISGDDKGRQEFDNIGKGIGYYITNGYAVPIRWEKTSRSAQTKYTYENGKEIEVNDGNTFIEVQPTNQELTIS